MASPLAAQIRAKHPGVYDDLDDAALESRVIAKYPQYKDLSGPAPPKAIASNEPDSYLGGFLKSAGDTALGTAKGIAEGIAAPVLHPIDTVSGAVNAIRHPLDTARGVGSFVKRAATEGLDPEEGGQAIGNLLTGLVAPKILPRVIRGVERVPSGLVKAGNAVAQVGKSSQRLTPYAIGASMFNPSALAVAAAPYLAEGAGKLISRAGVKMGGRLPTAGANLLRGGATVEDALLTALKESAQAEAPMKIGGVTRKLSGKTAAVNPDVSGGMITTAPDKFGASSIHARADEALAYPRSDTASAFSMAKRAAEHKARFAPKSVAMPDEPLAWGANMVDTGEGSTLSAENAMRQGLSGTPHPGTNLDPAALRSMRDAAQARHDALFTKNVGAWNMGGGPTLTASERALLDELRRSQPIRMSR